MRIGETVLATNDFYGNAANGVNVTIDTKEELFLTWYQGTNDIVYFATLVFVRWYDATRVAYLCVYQYDKSENQITLLSDGPLTNHVDMKGIVKDWVENR